MDDHSGSAIAQLPGENSIETLPTPKKRLSSDSGPASNPCITPERNIVPAAGADCLGRLRLAAASYKKLPSIFHHTSPEEVQELQKKVESKIPAWEQVYLCRPHSARRDLKYALRAGLHADNGRQGVQKVSKISKTKGAPNRTFTSKYRGVHQTFPTKRWEAQFRRNGKPTSLGCFDEEEQAARAYDKMMLWCELNSSNPMKNGYGITNFDTCHYEQDIPYLSSISQDDLTQALRQDGRSQAAKRALRQKREGQLGVAHLSSTYDQASMDEGGENSDPAKQSNSHMS